VVLRGVVARGGALRGVALLARGVVRVPPRVLLRAALLRAVLVRVLLRAAPLREPVLLRPALRAPVRLLAPPLFRALLFRPPVRERELVFRAPPLLRPPDRELRFFAIRLLLRACSARARCRVAILTPRHDFFVGRSAEEFM
jgi:hypothetical protein